ncbi:MAG: drug/metabolite transporter (DMT)-like permease [Paracoccaceae bacterium]
MDNLKGIVWMLLAMASFAVADALIKYTSRDVPIGQIVLVMGLGGTAVFSCWALIAGVPLRSKAFFHPAVLIRNLVEMVATIGVITALSLIPLATTSAILQINPLLVTLGAIVFFAERVGWRRWSAIAVGFAGVLLILRPGMGGFDPNVLFALVGAVGLAGRDLATRAVPRGIPSLQLSVYGFGTLMPVGLILIAFGPPTVAWTAQNIAPMMTIVLSSVIGYYAITCAMRVGEIAAVTPFRYSRLLFALVLGFVFFAEKPDAFVMIGAAMVVVSGLYTLARQSKP